MRGFLLPPKYYNIYLSLFKALLELLKIGDQASIFALISGEVKQLGGIGDPSSLLYVQH